MINGHTPDYVLNKEPGANCVHCNSMDKAELSRTGDSPIFASWCGGCGCITILNEGKFDVYVPAVAMK